MRRPCLASSPKRNRNRVLKNASRKQTCGRLHRRLSPRLPIGVPEDALRTRQISAATEAPNSATAEATACEPLRCGFGAVRVGALLGRLRLHLQTERFLAVHRGDTIWERACLGAALALAVMIAGMQEAELDAALSPQRALGTPARPLPAAARAPRADSRERELKKQIPRALFEMAQANELSPERPRNDSFLVSGSARGAR